MVVFKRDFFLISMHEVWGTVSYHDPCWNKSFHPTSNPPNIQTPKHCVRVFPPFACTHFYPRRFSNWAVIVDFWDEILPSFIYIPGLFHKPWNFMIPEPEPIRISWEPWKMPMGFVGRCSAPLAAIHPHKSLHKAAIFWGNSGISKVGLPLDSQDSTCFASNF